MKTSTSLLIFFKQLFLTCIAFILPIKGIIIVVGLMILLDTITGIYKAVKTNEKITSNKLRNIVSKMIMYEGAILLFFMIDKFLLGDIIGIFTAVQYVCTKLVALTLVAIEIKSIDENYKAISGTSLWDHFKDMLAKAKEIKKDVEDVTKKDE